MATAGSSNAPHMKSMFGLQADSKLASAPIYGFGTQERPEPASMEKGGKTSPGPIYLPGSESGGLRRAPEHSFGVSHRYATSAQKFLGSPVPGPGQYLNTVATGKQPHSQKYSYPTWKFGTGTRDDQAKVFISPAHSEGQPEFITSPGPCAYQHIGSLGGQADSRKPTNAQVGLGTAQRFFSNKAPADQVPGPGTYYLHPAVARQVHSHKTSKPINSFTKADRDRTAQAEYLGKNLLTGYSKASPGPAVYTMTESVGPQVSSVKKNPPKYGFGTCDRFGYIALVDKANQTPGPGSYSL